MTRVNRRYTLEDRAASVYQYLPFEVPAAASGVTVTLAYDRATGVVDLGLVAPDRFGGWSGGERSEVTVTREWATPGYVPGEVGGEWAVVLGLYRVSPGGVDVTVDVDVATRPLPAPPAPVPPPRPQRRPGRALPAAPGREWLACDFHSHTVHSDGALEIVELAVLAASRGLDVLAVTDHNTVSHHPHLAAAGAHAGVLLLPGQEVTTDQGHANCFGAIGWIDFRQPPDSWRATADARGGLMSVNHPWAGDCSWRMPLSAPATFVEMWHSTWDRRVDEPLDDWSDFGTVPIGGSDYHRHEDHATLAAPTTWVEADERSVEAVLAAMVDGRVAISADPASPVLVRHDGELVAVDADGTTLVEDRRGARLVVDGTVVAFTR